jgi:hypothetical protein
MGRHAPHPFLISQAQMDAIHLRLAEIMLLLESVRYV